MLANKDIIIRVLVGFFFFFFALRVLGPVFLNFLKRKMPGHYEPENDIDAMIRKQKERIRLQYGIPVSSSTDAGRINDKQLSTISAHDKDESPKTAVIESLYKETRWGGGEFIKSIQSLVAKNYSYTVAESKINAFILLSEKRKFLKYLSHENQNNLEAIKNYLSMIMVFMMMVEEVRTKDFTLIAKMAKKCHVTPEAFALALQIKILTVLSAKKNLPEDRLYSESIILHQFSEDTMVDATEILLKKEANIWAKGHSLFIEELALHLNYAVILSSSVKITHKKDVENARLILGVDEDDSLDDIKKTYKKLALTRHPDIIASQKLPKSIEKKAAQNFTMIQAAYDLLTTYKNKG